VDLSAGGLRLWIGRRFEKGALLQVELQEPTDHLERVILARVVRTAQHRDGQWILGCALANSLDPEGVQALTRPPA
jgi:hypothetical protein